MSGWTILAMVIAITSATCLSAFWGTAIDLYQETRFIPTNVAATQNDGNIVIAALDAYYAMHGRYPDNLDTLVPDHIESIPPVSCGDRAWRYRTRAGQSFTLAGGVGRGCYPCTYFDRPSGSWRTDQ